jgi:hypothetical protein
MTLPENGKLPDFGGIIRTVSQPIRSKERKNPYFFKDSDTYVNKNDLYRHALPQLGFIPDNVAKMQCQAIRVIQDANSLA